MDKVWVDKQIQEEQNEINKVIDVFKNIFNGINNPDFFDEDDRKKLIKLFIKRYFQIIKIRLESIKKEKNSKNQKRTNWLNTIDLDKLIDQLYFYNNKYEYIEMYHSCLDSEPKCFSGDIIITDPCYIVKECDDLEQDYTDIKNKYLHYDFPMQYDDFKVLDDDYSSIKTFDDVMEYWENMDRINREHFVICNGYSEKYEKGMEAYKFAIEQKKKQFSDMSKCEYGKNMELLGFKNYMVRDTLYGNWFCTTYNSDTKEIIGNFCSNKELVGVFLLDEVLKYDPYFVNHIEDNESITLIKDFEGMIQFVVNKNDNWNLHVIGTGKNKITGEQLNFITNQTRLKIKAT